MSVRVPCHGCNRRELSCHSTCAEWQEYKAAFEAEKAADRPGAEYGAYKRSHMRDLAKKHQRKRGNRIV